MERTAQKKQTWKASVPSEVLSEVCPWWQARFVPLHQHLLQELQVCATVNRLLPPSSFPHITDLLASRSYTGNIPLPKPFVIKTTFLFFPDEMYNDL